MKLFFAAVILGTVSASPVFNGNEWKELKSPLDSPRYHEIINGIFPSVSGKVIRGSRIAGGEVAKLGQFIHQALLLNVDNLGDNYICGGSIISHNYILTVRKVIHMTTKFSTDDLISCKGSPLSRWNS